MALRRTPSCSFHYEGRLAVTRSLTTRQAGVLGLVVLAGLSLGAMGLFALGGREWSGAGAYRVTAGFADIGGLELGTRVRIQGMDVGEVESILPPQTPGQPVRLQLRLAGKYRHLVGRDAYAQIASDGLLGNKIVRIVPGNAGAEPLGD